MIVKTRTPMRKFGGKIVGWIEEDKDGNQDCRDFSGKLLGSYNKKEDITRKFGGRMLGKGNLLMSLLDFN